MKNPALTPEPVTAESATATDSSQGAYWPCDASEEPQVFAMGSTESGADLPPICITGFAADGEVDLSVTYPSGDSDYFVETTDETGTAMVDWSAGSEMPEGTYEFEAYQDDMSAWYSVEVGLTGAAQDTAPEPLDTTAGTSIGGETIEVYPAGGSGIDFGIALSGFEPYQQVPLTLYVATDEGGSDFEAIDTLYLEVDEQGETIFPLQIDPTDWPSSLFAVEYAPEDGATISVSFQVGW